MLAGATLVGAAAFTYILNLVHVLVSCRLLELGLVLAFAPFLRTSKIALGDFRQWRLLTILCFVGLLYRAAPNLIAPLPVGSDTARYLYEAKFLADRFPDMLQVIFYHESQSLFLAYFEPFTAIFFAALVKLGLPLIWIPKLIIPAISSATIVPFYFIARRTENEEVATIATLMLAFGVLQMRFVNDLYRNVVGNLFMLCALYFILSERRSTLIISIIFTTLTFVSHLYPSIILVFTLLVEAISSRDFALARRSVVVFFASALLSIVPLWSALVTMNPHLWRQGLQSFGQLVQGAIYPFAWDDGMFLVALPSIMSAFGSAKRRGELNLSFLASVILLMALSFLRIVGGEPARFGLYIEFPLAVYAARTVSNSSRTRDILILTMIWVVSNSLSWEAAVMRIWWDEYRRFGFNL
jgi:hypothetical protein